MSSTQHPPSWRGIVVALLLALSPAAAFAADPPPGFEVFGIPATGSYFWRYTPPDLPAGQPAPVIFFLHGSGGTPENYLQFVAEPARQTRAILILPKSESHLGWGEPEDELTVTESLRMVREALPVDERRIAVAGHSSGGAYAYLLAYQTRLGFNAVFSMAARYYQVTGVADPAYKAPIRMYYGSEDPNYSGGSAAALKQQWQRLGIPWEEEVRPGAPHRDMSQDSILRGFQFLLSKSRPAAAGCTPGPATLCLGGGRFRVEVAWKDFAGKTGVGSVVPVTAEDSGLFWFFDSANWEMLVKVLDGCALNGRFWVFAAATTTVEHTLTVTDTLTGETAAYHNPPGQAAATITDTDALSGCS